MPAFVPSLLRITSLPPSETSILFVDRYTLKNKSDSFRCAYL